MTVTHNPYDPVTEPDLAELYDAATALSDPLPDDPGIDPEYLDALEAEGNAREQAEGQATPDWRSQMLDGATFGLDVPADVPAVWGSGTSVLWAAGEALMLVGPQGVGKTTLAGQLILGRLGLTTKALGQPVVPGSRRVLWIAADRPRQAQRSFHRLVRPEHREALADRLVVWKGPPPRDFAQDTSLMRQMCDEADADTVLIDSVKDVAVGLAKDEIGAAYNRARQLAITGGVEVLELHHQTKRGGDGMGKPNTIADVYGSVWITAGAGSVVLLWGDPGDPIVGMKHLKQPAEEVGPYKLRHDHTTGTTAVHHGVDLLQAVRDERDAGLTAKDAARLLFDTQEPSDNEVEKARRRLDKLAKDGAVRKHAAVGRGAQSTYHDASLIDSGRRR